MCETCYSHRKDDDHGHKKKDHKKDDCKKQIVKKECECKKTIFEPKVHYEDVKITKNVKHRVFETTTIERCYDVHKKPEVCHKRKPCDVTYEPVKTIKWKTCDDEKHSDKHSDSEHESEHKKCSSESPSESDKDCKKDYKKHDYKKNDYKKNDYKKDDHDDHKNDYKEWNYKKDDGDSDHDDYKKFDYKKFDHHDKGKRFFKCGGVCPQKSKPCCADWSSKLAFNYGKNY